MAHKMVHISGLKNPKQIHKLFKISHLIRTKAMATYNERRKRCKR